MRTTKADVIGVAKAINEYVKNHGAKWYINVEWAYGRPRAYLYNYKGEQLRTLSPRLSTGPLRDYLCAFYKGLEMGINLDAVA